MAIRISTEARLLDAAEELFFTRGIAATPVDAVLARAGVSAATLYRGYPSKEALVAAALDRRHRAWLDCWEAAVRRRRTARTRLLAVFDALDEFRGRPDGARWCAFLGSAAEYADPPTEVAAAVQRDTATLRARLTALAEPVTQDAAELAERMLLLMTGSLAMRLREPGSDTATARAVAEVLIAAMSTPVPS
ncbi:helix-turn-helix domain-containing protein [Cellulomonas sp. NPDC089187]|uniref:TetR/AcrR family transcriptional regulator n=1 Tax=Cellulomonas sp. NPDC089187 TaxID=3154970 RepID=UPI003426300A